MCTITYATRGGLDTHVIFHVHRNKARKHNANTMCTLNPIPGTCPKTCGNGQGALAQVFRALAHAYWPTYPNKIDQSRSVVQVHVHVHFIHNQFPSLDRTKWNLKTTLNECHPTKTNSAHKRCSLKSCRKDWMRS